MLFTVLLELELPSTTLPPSLSIQFLFHVSDVVRTKNLKQLKVGQNAPQNLVKISGHPPPPQYSCLRDVSGRSHGTRQTFVWHCIRT